MHSNRTTLKWFWIFLLLLFSISLSVVLSFLFVVINGLYVCVAHWISTSCTADSKWHQQDVLIIHRFFIHDERKRASFALSLSLSRALHSISRCMCSDLFSINFTSLSGQKVMNLNVYRFMLKLFFMFILFFFLPFYSLLLVFFLGSMLSRFIIIFNEK